MGVKIALAGNPNSGKTTLFNALTGSNQFVGNWPGVTVEKKEGRLKDDKDRPAGHLFPVPIHIRRSGCEKLFDRTASRRDIEYRGRNQSGTQSVSEYPADGTWHTSSHGGQHDGRGEKVRRPD